MQTAHLQTIDYYSIMLVICFLIWFVTTYTITVSSYRTSTQCDCLTISLWGGVKAQLDSLLLCIMVLVAIGRHRKGYWAIWNSIENSIEACKIYAEHSYLAEHVFIRLSLFSINQTFTGYGPSDCSAFARISYLDNALDLYHHDWRHWRSPSELPDCPTLHAEEPYVVPQIRNALQGK